MAKDLYKENQELKARLALTTEAYYMERNIGAALEEENDELLDIIYGDEPVIH